MEAKLEQMRALQLRERIGRMDPNPLTDNLGKAPLPGNAPTNEAEHLRERQGPALLVERRTELARAEPKRLDSRRTTGRRLNWKRRTG